MSALKSLFADLGRPTLRGIRKCPKCGTVNGTRGNSCKNKDCDVIFRGALPNKEPLLEASQLRSLPGFQEQTVYYSVRNKEKGKDNRNFVLHDLTSNQFRCLLESCPKQEEKQCIHIVAAQKCSSIAPSFPLNEEGLRSLSIPQHHQQEIAKCVHASKASVQRVSKAAFVLSLSKTDELEMVHCLISKNGNEKAFNCACFSKNRESDSSSEMCVHFYLFVLAAVNDEGLKQEFEKLIPQPQPKTAQQVSSPFLSQLHLVSSDGKSVELDGNLSVEIMQDNLSLLEMSISGQDESTLTNVQTLEGVLTADPIIVTNVEDGLAFEDGTVLDSLDDDQQVCHIFSNPQTTIHLSYSDETPQPTFGKSTVTSSQENNNNNNKTSENIAVPAKKRKIGGKPSYLAESAKGSERSPQAGHEVVHVVQEVRPSGDKASQHFWEFENWLAGVNDLINNTMHYQLPPNPPPLVYYIPDSYFEFLKERLTIATGSVSGHKKRLPNQTFVFQRTDKPPIGSFTKHVWKITNILHVLKVFECSLVRIKPKQYFTKTSNGNYVEWIFRENNNETNSNQQQKILPVLHTTLIKCGRNYPSPSKEVVPFTIEWVPDILRTSKLGELTIVFQFQKGELSGSRDPNSPK